MAASLISPSPVQSSAPIVALATLLERRRVSSDTSSGMTACRGSIRVPALDLLFNCLQNDVPRPNYVAVPRRVAPGLPEMWQGKKSYGSEHTYTFSILRYRHLRDLTRFSVRCCYGSPGGPRGGTTVPSAVLEVSLDSLCTMREVNTPRPLNGLQDGGLKVLRNP